MSYGLGIAADAAASHCHVFPALHSSANVSEVSSGACIPSLLSSQAMNFISSITSPRPPLSLSSTSSPAIIKSATTDISLDDTPSQTTSIRSSELPSKTARRRSSKSKTTFQLAHPPPILKHWQRLRIRPKLLLQLQQTSEASRPTPILDVLPSITFAPNFARKFPRIFHGRDGLGADDLIVVHSEDYDGLKESTRTTSIQPEDERWDQREVVAAICQPRKSGNKEDDVIEICLNQGASWHGSILGNGAYEFVTGNEEEGFSVARWVPPKSMGRGYDSNMKHPSALSSNGESGFKFSLINPRSRRHPILATMNDRVIDISDRYTIPGSGSIGTLGAESFDSLLIKGSPDDMSETASLDRRLIEVDEGLRTLIVVTGIWIAFREGWSPNFSYDTSSEERKLLRKKRNVSVGSNHTSSLVKTNTSSLEGECKERSKPKPGILYSSSSSIISSPPIPSREFKSPQRAMSTGTAFLQRANGRKGHTADRVAHLSSLPSAKSSEVCEVGIHNTTGGRMSLSEYLGSIDSRDQLSSTTSFTNATTGTPLTTINSELAPEDSKDVAERGYRKPTKLKKMFSYLRRSNSAR